MRNATEILAKNGPFRESGIIKICGTIIVRNDDQV